MCVLGVQLSRLHTLTVQLTFKKLNVLQYNFFCKKDITNSNDAQQ